MEESQRRLAQLSRMSYGSLHALLTGDPVAAAASVRCAAECGVAAAQLRMGRMLLDGTGVEPDERAVVAALAASAHPALRRVRARVLALPSGPATRTSASRE